MKEEWKLIKGFENYKISNMGRVFSCKTNRIMKPTSDTKGYLRITFYDNGKNNTRKVHRLVAQAFIPNDLNYPQVNHKDEDKENNCAGNLEWCDNTYNRHYGTATERTARANLNCETTSRPVRCVDTGEIYPSIREARRRTGAANIHYCCAGKRITSNGYRWEYVEVAE